MQSKPGNTLVAAPNKQPIEAESERMKLANIKSICTLWVVSVLWDDDDDKNYGDGDDVCGTILLILIAILYL